VADRDPPADPENDGVRRASREKSQSADASKENLVNTTIETYLQKRARA
jgi:hypothetical protein